jgi:hypothetical protein
MLQQATLSVICENHIVVLFAICEFVKGERNGRCLFACSSRMRDWFPTTGGQSVECGCLVVRLRGFGENVRAMTRRKESGGMAKSTSLRGADQDDSSDESAHRRQSITRFTEVLGKSSVVGTRCPRSAMG